MQIKCVDVSLLPAKQRVLPDGSGSTGQGVCVHLTRLEQHMPIKVYAMRGASVVMNIICYTSGLGCDRAGEPVRPRLSLWPFFKLQTVSSAVTRRCW